MFDCGYRDLQFHVWHFTFQNCFWPPRHSISHFGFDSRCQEGAPHIPHSTLQVAHFGFDSGIPHFRIHIPDMSLAAQAPHSQFHIPGMILAARAPHATIPIRPCTPHVSCQIRLRRPGHTCHISDIPPAAQRCEFHIPNIILAARGSDSTSQRQIWPPGPHIAHFTFRICHFEYDSGRPGSTWRISHFGSVTSHFGFVISNMDSGSTDRIRKHHYTFRICHFEYGFGRHR